MRTDLSPFIEYVLGVFDEKFIPMRSKFLTDCLRITFCKSLEKFVGQKNQFRGGGSQTFGFGSPNGHLVLESMSTLFNFLVYLVLQYTVLRKSAFG